MSHLILWNITNIITEEILRNTFGENGNIMNIQLLFSVDKTDSGFALIDFRTKEECTTVIKKFYELKIHHLHPAIKLQQFSKIDNCKKTLNTEMVNNNTIYFQRKNIIQEYEQTSNLDIVTRLLVNDQKSIIRTTHNEFAKTMSRTTLYDYHPILTTKKKQRKIISSTAYTHGISNAIKEWMYNNEVESCIEMHALFNSIISKCAISSKVEGLTNVMVPSHHDVSYVEILQSILEFTKNHYLKLILAENTDIVLNNITPKILPILMQSFKMLASKNNAMQIFVDAFFNKEVFSLQQNNLNTLISSSIRSNPKLIDGRGNYPKMNILIDKSISFNEPKNQQDCNNNQKNDAGNILHNFSQTPTPSKVIASLQVVNEPVERVPQSFMSSNTKASSKIVQKPIKKCSSNTKKSGQSSISKKKTSVIRSDCVPQTIKKNETKQVNKKTTNEVPICPANIILKKKHLSIYSDEWKIKRQMLISTSINDQNNCLKKLNVIMYCSMNNLQLSNPLMNNSSREPLINILPKSTLPNCPRRKDTINNIFIDENTFKQSIMSEKKRYKKSVNISISGGAKVQREEELSDEKIHIQCLAAIEQMETFIEDVIDLMISEPHETHYLKHEIFVVSMVVIAMKKTSTNRNETGDIFAKLLTAKILSITSLTKGINHVLRNWSEFLSYNIHIFLLADIFIPLLISNCFEFSNVMDCIYDVNKTERLITFIEILDRVNNLKENKYIKEYNGVVSWSCNKWNKSKHTESFIDFVSNSSLSFYLISNGLDQTAILILSMAMRDVIRGSKNNMYLILTSWVNANLDIHLIDYSCFTRAITIAVILVIINDNEFDSTFDNFFQNVHIKIFKRYITSKRWDSQSDIQERELHCLYGIQTVCAALKYPKNMLFKLFSKLYECQIVSKKSFLLWKNDETCTCFPEDHETKSKAVSLSSSFFRLLNQKSLKK